uniref:ABC transporter related protein n=1 Tax=Mycobacterium sp. (strain JLS) TaxID=164757 RepID=A0A5Q5CKZ6_MYCSJ
MIETVGLTKSYRRRTAVADVSLTFPSGAVTYLLGLNGAGKTSLLRLVAGLTTADSGWVSICGRQLHRERDPMRLLGSSLEPGVMNPRHTVRRHLNWLATLGGLPGARVDAVLAETDLTSAARQRISSLSLGARQRVAIAGALLGDPAAVVLDEPLNGLDVPGIVWLRELLRRLAADGRTLVVASHLLSEVVLTADRIVVLQNGRVALDAPFGDLTRAGSDPREHLERIVVG